MAGKRTKQHHRLVKDNRLIVLLQLIYVTSGLFDIGWLFFGLEQFKLTVARNTLIKISTVMLPFTFLLMWTAKEKLLKGKGRQICFTSILWYSTKVAFLFSLTIEFLQLFLRLGTFQLSDLCYNTLGGAIGGVLYWMGWKVKK